MNFSQFVFITIGLISVNVQSTHIEPRHHHNNNNSNNNNIHQHQLDTLASKLIASMGIDKLPNYTNVSTNITFISSLKKILYKLFPVLSFLLSTFICFVCITQKYFSTLQIGSIM